MAFCQNNADRFAHYNPTFSPILAIWYTRSTQEWNDQLGVVGGKHFHNPFHKWCIAPAIFTSHVIHLVIYLLCRFLVENSHTKVHKRHREVDTLWPSNVNKYNLNEKKENYFKYLFPFICNSDVSHNKISLQRI